VVSVLRAASAMAESMTREYPNMPVGTILIQRDEATAQPVLIYSVCPRTRPWNNPIPESLPIPAVVARMPSLSVMVWLSPALNRWPRPSPLGSRNPKSSRFESFAAPKP
jgi:hypothetical protein